MDLKLLNNNNQDKELAIFKASDRVFACKFNQDLIHQVIIAFNANARCGNRSQKNRSAVRHSTKKPWRQKGTGRARAGMVSSPLWRGGGRAFPSNAEENFSQKVNKKMYRAAICSILSELVRQDRFFVLEDTFTFETPKTKLAKEKLKELDLDSVLIIKEDIDQNTYLATRNLKGVAVINYKKINPVLMLYYKKILIVKSAIARIEEILK